MIKDTKNFQWWADFLFPLLITLGVAINAPYVLDEQTIAATLFHGSFWFLWIWVGILFISNLATTIGVFLRRLKSKWFIWFEYPGSILATFSLLIYATILLIANPGPAALSIAVTLVISVHYLKNFLIIYHSIFHK
jgi:hypothetical protein